ncbi:MAG: thioether cross-link-forming SCIFF peptide maturase [Clostridia bacterium]|jgi:uncharacterized protein|nr:thioether cross-link-forming SCIFF peptide maturase [Clostridiales bacterium]
MTLIHRYIKNGVPIVLDVASGAVHVVDRLVYRILDFYPEQSDDYIIDRLKNEYAKKDLIEGLEEIRQLQKEGLLFSKDTYVETASNRYNDQVIKALCLHVAHDCNLSCRYCFASQGDFKGQRLLMDCDTAYRAVDFLIKKSGKRHNIEIDFFGGEPLLNLPVVKKTVEYGRKRAAQAGKEIRFTLTTNGVGLDSETIEYLDDNMYNVVLSLDGRPEVNDRMRCFRNGVGSYDSIVDGIVGFVQKRADRSYFVRGTFTRENLDFCEDVLHIAGLGIKSLSVEPVVSGRDEPYSIREQDLGTVLREYDRLFDECLKRAGTPEEFSFYHFKVNLYNGPCAIKRLSGCGAGNQYIAVTPEGDLYPCHQFVGEEGFLMGNVFDGMLDSRIAAAFRDAHVYNKEDCRDCWARLWCSGGCHASSYKTTGSLQKSYSLGCEMEKKRIECAIALEAMTRIKEDTYDKGLQG